MVFQSFNLFPHMTVLENVIEAPMRVSGATRRGDRERARELLARVGLGDRARPTRGSSRAASSSAWRSPARWRWTRS